MHSSAFDHPYPPFLNDLSSPHQGFSYDCPIQIPSSPDSQNKPNVVSPFATYLYSTYQDPFSIRATASASTPSTSSIDTPVHDGFTAHPIIADESCHNLQDGASFLYSGQEASPWMPSDVSHCPPLAPSSKPSSNGVIRGHQALASAPLQSHPVMSQHLHRPSLASTGSSDQTHQPSSGMPVFTPSGCHAHAQPLARDVYPTSLVQRHHHSESTMTVVYDMAMSRTKTTQTSTTTSTVLQSGVSPANVCTGLALDPYQTSHSCASTRITSQHPPFAQSRLTSNELHPSSAPSYHPFSYVTTAPVPTSRSASVPLYQPKPMRPLPEWTKKSSLISDELLPQVPFGSYPETSLPHAVLSPSRASSAFSAESCQWAYGAPVPSATIEEMVKSYNNDDGDDFDEDIDDDEYDDEGGDDDDTDMEGTECGFEMENIPGIDPATPEFHISSLDSPAFRGTLSSAAVPLSSSSLLCQPLPDAVQSQFRLPVTQTFSGVGAHAPRD
ncbi:hypothetical protein BJV78DRAFT_24236 [Lactifluus subvellereus]|nr:hypothetical protein BJV78DRAFT_24236 [Lactifluus subvellereus]